VGLFFQIIPGNTVWNNILERKTISIQESYFPLIYFFRFHFRVKQLLFICL